MIRCEVFTVHKVGVALKKCAIELIRDTTLENVIQT